MKVYRVRLLGTAHKDLMDAAEYLSGYSITAAADFLAQAQESISSLATMPNRHPEYEHFPEYRKLQVKGHLVFYKVNEANSTVDVYRIINGKMDVPKHLEE